MTPPEKVRMARQLDALGVDIIEAGFPIASDGDFEAVRAVAAEVRRPTIAGLARAVSADVMRAAQALERANHPRIHVVPRHLGPASARQAAHRSRTLPRAGGNRRTARATARDDVEFSAEDATRSDLAFLCEVAAAVGRRRRHDRQPAGHGRLRAAGRHRAHVPRCPRAHRARHHAVRALPRRSRHGGRQFARRRAGRRSPGRVHDQRHRRARRQRVARRVRDGAASAARCAAIRHVGPLRAPRARRAAS